MALHSLWILNIHKKRLDYEIANANTSFEEYYFKWNIQCQAKKLCYDRNCVNNYFENYFFVDALL